MGIVGQGLKMGGIMLWLVCFDNKHCLSNSSVISIFLLRETHRPPFDYLRSQVYDEFI